MGKGAYLCDFEQLVLLAILRLREHAYGLKIREEISACAGRTAAIEAVYATLDRLQSKGLVTSFDADPTPERGGRAKRYFQLSAAGVAAVRTSRDATLAMMKGLEALWNT